METWKMGFTNVLESPLEHVHSVMQYNEQVHTNVIKFTSHVGEITLTA